MTTNTITKNGIRKQFNLLGLAFLIMFLLWAGMYYGYNYALNNYGFYLQDYDMTTVNLGLSMIGKFISMALPFCIMGYALKIKTSFIFRNTHHSPRGLFTFFCAGVAVYLFLTFLSSNLYTMFNPGWIDITSMNPIFQSSNLVLQIIYLLYFIIVVPFVEEYVFRGIVLRTLSRAGGIFGLITSSLIYAIYCFGKSEFILVMGVSFFLGTLAMVYLSVWPAIIAHIGINAIIVYGLFIPAEYTWVLGIIAIVVYAFAIYAFYRNRDRKLKWNKNIPANVAWNCFFTSPIILLAIVLLILRCFYNIFTYV